MSEDELKAFAEEENCQAITMRKDGTIAYRRTWCYVTPEYLVDKGDVKGCWMRNYKSPEASSEKDGADWLIVKGYHPGSFDVLRIKGWKKTHTLDELKKKCIENGWSGFTMGANDAIFKTVGYDLTPNRLKKSAFNTVPFYINLKKKPAEPAFGKWEWYAGKQGPKKAEDWRYFEKRDLSVEEDLRRYVEYKGYIGFSISKAKNPVVHFFRTDYQLEEKHLKDDKDRAGTWIWIRPAPTDVAVEEGPNWT